MKHALRGISVALVLTYTASLLWAALPFTDAFGSANGTLLTTHSANWTVPTSTTVTIQGGAVGCTNGSAICYGRVNSETFSDDQYGQCVVKTPLANYYQGPHVRLTGSGTGGYKFVVDDNEFLLQEINSSGGDSVLTSTTGTVNANDILYLEAVGTTLTAKVNGITKLTITDGTWTTGYPGVGGYNTVTTSTTRCDDFEAGNVSAGGSPSRKRSAVPMMFGFAMGKR